VGGVAHYGDIIDGVTMEEKLDEVTGLSRAWSSSPATRTLDPASL
jgi:hypothetical protein